MYGDYNHRRKRRITVKYIIEILEEILDAEEVYYNSLPAHPSFEEQVSESVYNLFEIDEALGSLRSAYYLNSKNSV